MKFDTHLCLVSDQATPNLAAALDEEWRPRRVVLAVSKGMEARADYLEPILRRHGITTQRLALADAYDYFPLYQAFFDFLADEGEGDAVALNVTGGTKIMAMAAQEAFRDAKRPVFYVNVETDEVLTLGKEGRSTPLSARLKLREFLEAHGFTLEPEGAQKPEVRREQAELTARLVEGVERFGPVLGRLNVSASEPKAKAMLPVPIPDTWGQETILQEMIELFADGGHLLRGTNEIRFTSESSRVFVAGGWLEQHVFETVKNLAPKRGFADYGINLKVRAPNGTTLNELDCAFLYRNTLYIVECKAANLALPGNSGDDKGTEAIYKLETLLKMGGLRTQGMLIDYRGRLAGSSGLPNGQQQANLERARASRIKVVSAGAIKTLRGEIERWIA